MDFRYSLLLPVFLTACSPHVEPIAISAQDLAQSAEMFDDFSYSKTGELIQHGWRFRQTQGWPGVEGASWGEPQFELVDDADEQGGRALRMSAQTDGSGKGTRQAQLCHARKYFTGTYAARVKFSDEPVKGPDVDQVVQTFYTISPLLKDLDPDYSELDNEYLPNGGWGVDKSVLFNTSWKMVQMQPWLQFNKSDLKRGSRAGWRTLVMQVAGGEVKYFLDGKLSATHGGQYYPRVPMSINFNLWFTREGLAAASGLRVWQQDIDWVFFAKDKVISPDDVERRVAGLRLLKITTRDTVPTPNPILPSDCNM